MYFELTAPNRKALQRAFLDADIMGLDPEYFHDTLTFSIGTGNIEKVSALRDKYNLVESYTADSIETGYRS